MDTLKNMTNFELNLHLINLSSEFAQLESTAQTIADKEAMVQKYQKLITEANAEVERRLARVLE